MAGESKISGGDAGELGSVFPSHSCYMASLEQVAGHRFSFGFCCGWYFSPSCLLVTAGLVTGMGLLFS